MLKYSELIARNTSGKNGANLTCLQLKVVPPMVYIFNTLKSNRLLNKGDTIAIGAPIFTPYIEMPELEDYSLNKVEILGNRKIAWQILILN
ncbi:hypothetical protein O9992_30435 [Vibrio lentus]|nr:hypothetical protein [Vibrio lentus]